MELARALRLQPGQLVTFTGAGGKTSALRRLAQELPSQLPLVLATTTRLGVGQEALARYHWIPQVAPSGQDLLALLGEHGSVLLTGAELPGEKKWSGVPSEWLDDLKAAVAEAGGVLAVEGDGARQREIKAPAEHEPVVPESSDLVVPVASLRALGEPLSKERAHRPEAIAAITELKMGEVLTVGAVARLLTSPQGGGKGIPTKASVRILLTGAETPARLQRGRQLGDLCLKERNVQAALLADLRKADPVEEVVGRVAGVVLAAGGSSRMEGLKQVERWEGKPLVAYALEAAVAGGLAPVILVVGEGADRVRSAAGGRAVRIVHNPDWKQGQSTSVRAGLTAAKEAGVEAVVFLLADMPLVSGEVVGRLRRRHAATLAPIVAPRAEGRLGNPVLFDRATYQALAQVEGDRGGRALYESFEIEKVEADRAVLVDVDQAEDWRRLE